MNASSGSGLWPILTSRSMPAEAITALAGQPLTASRARSGRCAAGAGAPSSALAEPQPHVAGTDSADDRVAVARGVDLDPRAAEVRRPVRIVGSDLHQRDGLGVVGRPVEPGVGHLDGIERPAEVPDDADAVERLPHAE